MKNWLKKMNEKTPIMFTGWERILMVVCILAGTYKFSEWMSQVLSYIADKCYDWKTRKEGHEAGKLAAEEEDFED